MQTPRKQCQCTSSEGEDERTPDEGHDQESSVCDSEDAVILTARRVKIVRCRAKRTTLSSVRFRQAIFHRMRLTVSSAIDGRVKGMSRLRGIDNTSGHGSRQASVETIAGHPYSLA